MNFILFALLVIYPFGLAALVISHFDLPDPDKTIFSFSLGLVSFTLTSLLLFILHLTVLLPLVSLLPLSYLLVFNRSRLTPRLSPSHFLVAFLAILITFPVYLPYGWASPTSLRLYGAHTVDATNSIALTRMFNISFPPPNPNLSDTTFVGYHYFFNLFLSAAHTVTRVDLFDLYFRYVPVFLVGLLALSIYRLVLALGQNHLSALLALLFSLLSSNWYFIAPLFYPLARLQPSVAWADTFSTSLVNYQFLSSLVILILIFRLLLRLSSRRQFFLMTVIIAALAGFKIYAWVILQAALLSISSWRRLAVVSILATLPVLFLLSPARSQFPFLISPLWLIRTMYESPDRLNFPVWELKRQTLLALHSYPGIIRLYFTGLSFFLVINFGPRLIGLIAPRTSKIHSLIVRMLWLALLASLIFIQVGTAWNIVQFLYYSIFLSGLSLAFFLSRLKLTLPRLLLGTLIWLSLLPGVVSTTREYFRPPYYHPISSSLIAAADFLSSRPIGAVILPPDLTAASELTALSGLPAYFAGDLVLRSYSIDASLRQKLVGDFYSAKLSDSQIRALQASYVIGYASSPPLSTSLNPIYRNSEIVIYNIKR